MRSPSPIDALPPAASRDAQADPAAPGAATTGAPDGPARALALRGGGPDRPARRSFLLGGAGVTAALAAAPQAARAFESPEEQVEQRYARTPHVERFYFLNRL